MRVFGSLQEVTWSECEKCHFQKCIFLKRFPVYLGVKYNLCLIQAKCGLVNEQICVHKNYYQLTRLKQVLSFTVRRLCIRKSVTKKKMAEMARQRPCDVWWLLLSVSCLPFVFFTMMDGHDELSSAARIKAVIQPWLLSNLQVGIELRQIKEENQGTMSSAARNVPPLYCCRVVTFLCHSLLFVL